MSEAQATYPPSQHLLNDLCIVVERDEEGATGCLEIVPEMLDAAGRVRVGLLATLVDVVAGETAIRAVAPEWIATSDLSVHVETLPASGLIEVRPHVIRRGRQTVVLEAPFRIRGTGDEIGLATLGFAILPARSDFQKSGHASGASGRRTEFARQDSGLRKPVSETLGIEFNAERADIAHLGVRPYLINSLGALQGGAVALFAETTADHFAASVLAGPVHVRGLAIHYLKLGRVGPVRAQARTLARTAGGLLVRVELFDEGIDDELLTVATVQIDRDETRSAT